MKLQKKLLAVASAAVVALTGLGASSPAALQTPLIASAAADSNHDDWLHAVGSRLYDKDGNEVWLTGANWFGFNCTENVLHYLWNYDIDEAVATIADHGINCLRIPVSTQLLYSWMIGNPDEIQSVNPSNDPYYLFNVDLLNEDGSVKNSLEVFDVLMAKCKKYGVKMFIDVHSPDANNSGHNYGIWYGKTVKLSDGSSLEITTEVWQETLVWLADHYKNDDTLIGYDLKNEPHSVYGGAPVDAIWDGSNAPNNWKKAAEDCALAIMEVNPNALIFIEGVEGYQGHGAWWGGNLRGVKDYPVDIGKYQSQIVYSPHDYGPLVSPQTWFEKDFTEQTLLDDYWYDTWAYINDTGIAPLLIGEWGGFMDGGDNEKWMTLIRDYMIKNHINHTFWCLNADSGDTGGLWGPGSTIEWEQDKYELFEPSLWQTQETGKYIGLDHQTPLGVNGTGLSLSEFYSSYVSTEGSNLDGGTIGSNPVTTTSQNGSTGTTTTTTGSKPLLGDINQDGSVTISDMVLLSRYLLEYRSVSAEDVVRNWNAGDVNNDKKLNGFDLAIYKRHFLTGKPFSN